MRRWAYRPLIHGNNPGRSVAGAGYCAFMSIRCGPAFACIPDAFPDLLGIVIAGGDVAAWAGRDELARGGSRAAGSGQTW